MFGCAPFNLITAMFLVVIVGLSLLFLQEDENTISVIKEKLIKKLIVNFMIVFFNKNQNSMLK